MSRLFPFTMMILLLLAACARSATEPTAAVDARTIVVHKSPT